MKLENIHKIFQTFDLQHLTVRCTTYGLGADGRTNRRTSVIVLGVFEAVCTVRIQRQGPASVTDHRYQVDKMTFHGLNDTILWWGRQSLLFILLGIPRVADPDWLHRHPPLGTPGQFTYIIRWQTILTILYDPRGRHRGWQLHPTMACFRKQGKSEGFDSCDWPSYLTQIGLKSSIFQPMWPWNLMDDLE